MKRIALILCISFLWIGTSPAGPDVHTFSSYRFDPNSRIESRIAPPPDFVLHYLCELDKRSDYTVYMPDQRQRTIITDTIALLPPGIKKICGERLIGIYFINNLQGTGLTEWVRDPQGRLYSFMAINPNSFDHTLSDWLTYKENTCFQPDRPDLSLGIDCGIRYTGFLYALLHETAHVVDYAMNKTPYVEEAVKTPTVPVTTAFIRDVWRKINVPLARYDFSDRSAITFYGFGSGPRLCLSQAASVYRRLSQTPFPSLYASASWAEDYADFVFFYHLTQRLGLPYIITIWRDDQVMMKLEPMNAAAVKARYGTMHELY